MKFLERKMRTMSSGEWYNNWELETKPEKIFTKKIIDMASISSAEAARLNRIALTDPRKCAVIDLGNGEKAYLISQ